MFFEITQCNIYNFADDKTPHVSGYVLNDVLNLLEQCSTILIVWFRDGKYYLLVSGHKHESVIGYIGETKIWEKYCAKLFRFQIDRYLKRAL